MAEFPALQLWTDAYLGDTTHLTCMEHGAYLLLLMTAWRTRDCRLPDDDKLLARYARCTKGQWTKIRPILEPFYTIENGLWLQSRLIDEAKAVRTRKAAAAIGGKASALKRNDRHSANVEKPSKNRSTATPTDFNITTATATIPLSNDNGHSPDLDRLFWDAGKAYLKPYVKGDPGALVGKWCRDYGKAETRFAISTAQSERAMDPISFVTKVLRNGHAGNSDDAPWPC